MRPNQVQKKKILPEVLKDLKTNAQCVATWQVSLHPSLSPSLPLSLSLSLSLSLPPPPPPFPPSLSLFLSLPLSLTPSARARTLRVIACELMLCR